MQFNLYATFRLLAGVKTITIDLPDGTTVQQAVHAVVEKNPVLRPHWLDKSGEIHAHVHIFVNGQDVQNMEQRAETPLKAADVLDFFPPVGGGQGSNGEVIVLAMHGAPPLDYPRGELAEFFGLHSRMEHAPAEQRAGLAVRYTELNQKIRAWPRTAANDPFFTGASALADALSKEMDLPVILAFNEFCAPALDDALDQAANRGAPRVVVITPMVTRGGEHSEKDIPEAVQAAAERHPQTQYAYAWPLDLQAVAQFLAGQVKKYLT